MARIFQADYEVGDASEWLNLECKDAATQFKVVSGAMNGKNGRFDVAPGQKFSTYSGERCEVRTDTIAKPGNERWVRWHTRFPSGSFSPTPGSTWNIFAQLHQSVPVPGSPNIDFHINATDPEDPQIQAFVKGGGPGRNMAPNLIINFGPLVLAKNYRFVIGFVFSPDPLVGWVQAHMDDQLVLAKTGVATAYSDDLTGGYFKQGFYRADTAVGGPTTRIMHDSAVIGETYADVT